MNYCVMQGETGADLTQRKNILATPNYGYEKRQKELAKKKKKEEKLKAKSEKKGSPDPADDQGEQQTQDNEASSTGAANT